MQRSHGGHLATVTALVVHGIARSEIAVCSPSVRRRHGSLRRYRLAGGVARWHGGSLVVPYGAQDFYLLAPHGFAQPIRYELHGIVAVRQPSRVNTLIERGA